MDAWIGSLVFSSAPLEAAAARSAAERMPPPAISVAFRPITFRAFRTAARATDLAGCLTAPAAFLPGLFVARAAVFPACLAAEPRARRTALERCLVAAIRRGQIK